MATFPFPRTVASNNLRAVTHFQLQTAHAFSTEKVVKEEEPVAQAAETSKSTAVAKYDYDEHDDYDYEEPKTRGQKVIQIQPPRRSNLPSFNLLYLVFGYSFVSTVSWPCV